MSMRGEGYLPSFPPPLILRDSGHLGPSINFTGKTRLSRM